MHTIFLPRLAWPFGSFELRLPARPRHRHDKPALLWRQLVRRGGVQTAARSAGAEPAAVMPSRTPHDRGEPGMDGRDFHLPVDAARDIPADFDASALPSQVPDDDASPARRVDRGGFHVGATDESTLIDPSRSPA